MSAPKCVYLEGKRCTALAVKCLEKRRFNSLSLGECKARRVPVSVPPKGDKL